MNLVKTTRTAPDLIKKFEAFLLGKQIESDIRLSTVTGKQGNEYTKKQLHECFTLAFSQIGANHKPDFIGTALIVDRFYSEWYWLSLDQVFDFLRKMILGKLGTFYNRIDAKTVFEMAGVWEQQHAEIQQQYGRFTGLPPGQAKGNYIEMPEELKALANKIKYRQLQIEQKEPQTKTALEKLKTILQRRLHLNNDQSNDLINNIVSQIKDAYDTIGENQQTFEQFRDNHINELLYREDSKFINYAHLYLKDLKIK